MALMSSRHILSGAVLGSQCEPLDSTPRPTWSYSYLYSPHEDHKDTLHHAPLVNSLNVTALNLHVLVTLGLEGSLESREAWGALPYRGSGALPLTTCPLNVSLYSCYAEPGKM